MLRYLIRTTAIVILATLLFTSNAAFAADRSHTPAPGSKDRTGICDAARSFLGYSGLFHVDSMHVWDNVASALLEGEPQGTITPVFLYFERRGNGWRCLGQNDETEPFPDLGSTPPPGSSDRTAILDAARSFIGYSGKFNVQSISESDRDASAVIKEQSDPKWADALWLHFERQYGEWVCTGPEGGVQIKAAEPAPLAGVSTVAEGDNSYDVGNYDLFATRQTSPPLPDYRTYSLLTSSWFTPTPYLPLLTPAAPVFSAYGSNSGLPVYGDLNGDGRYVWPEMPYGANPSAAWTGSHTEWGVVSGYMSSTGTWVGPYWRRNR